MPIPLIKLDMEHNLDKDMEMLTCRRFSEFAVFHVDGEFCRIFETSRSVVQMHIDFPHDLVGVYDKKVERQWILDDIEEFKKHNV